MPRELVPLWHARLVNQTLRTQYAVEELAALGDEFVQDALDLRAELVRQAGLALKRPKTPPEYLLLSEMLMQLL